MNTLRPAVIVALTIAVGACTGSSGSKAAGPPDRVTSLPGYGTVKTTQYAGYASVDEAPCTTVRCDAPGEAGLFYWFVARPGEDRSTPTILWTNGGPGSTSFWGFFTENGPYAVGDDGRLDDRPMAWNETANYLIFDQPLGVGLSFAPDDRLPANLQQGVDQWYTALVHFLERHPDIAANPIVLAGESYGGTYLPVLARAILDGNTRAGREVVRLGGVIIAAGWVDPVVQQSMDTTYALGRGLITPQDKAGLDLTFEQCRGAVAAASPSTAEANDVCGRIKSGIAEISGRYLLNLGAPGDPPTGPMLAYLNRPDVRAAVHAKTGGEFTLFSEPIGDRYTVGSQDSYRPLVQALLDEGVPIMVISGLDDATDVNFMGTGAWLDLLQGERAAAFDAAPTVQWKVDKLGEGGTDGQVLGYVKEGGGLTWVKVLNAGHLAVLDQPLLIDLIDEKLMAPNG